ncbi:LOW QUALITY PROTEIN: E3 ubiquitin/ISG15 ligase TRIM25-like [Mixophyes fleayi]|uniref:LOW QUALITY PROTEIN: E3 ubiquitin/ISG15 ligase TRIM25-like n=1 Tax=Mixophyes fleayi TaxID=3061075 RepID=UPI003F4D7A2C
MASADLRDELNCSICLNIYTDPVTLRCGHNFCRVCIDCVLGTQEGSGVYTCPECRAEFKKRPVVQRNITLCNIVVSFLSTRPDQEENWIFCTYCIHSLVPASKSCSLHCEASLCDNHVRVHSKSAEHVLSDPTTSLGNRKCFVHKELFRYYCIEDATCICVSCSLIGEHRGHQINSLEGASEKKKEKLRNVLQKLTTKREETEKRVQSLQKRRREDQEKAAGVTERVTALFRDIRRQLDDLEKRVLSEISRQEESVSLSVSDLIQQLEIKKDELSRKMRHIEELCNMSDPVTVLQEPDTDDLCDTEDRERHDDQVHGVGDLDVGLISEKLHTLSDILRGINTGICMQEPTDILLDVNTAGNIIHVSGDMKTASWSHIDQNHPETPERFQVFPQVISTRRFSSGQHYWEVDVSRSGWWRVGMCYPSIDRRGGQSLIGNNNKSWGVVFCRGVFNNQYAVLHDRKEIKLLDNIPHDRVRVYLDYEAGQLSFIELCDPIRHLHTVTATFTEPLHAALWVGDGNIIISEKIRTMASADLRQELDCSICLNIYTDPVTLRCGHNFCRVCIDHVLDTQEGSGVYTCPECRAEFKKRPVVQRNITLCNIMGRFLSTQNKKCSVHDEIVKYLCSEDAACICVSCLIREHRGHQVESLDEASEKKKEKLRNVLKKLTTKRQETEKRVQSLQELRREDQEKAAGLTETVTALFRDIRRQLEDLEKRVLSEISRQEESVSLSVSDLIKQLEIKKDDLSRKMRHIEELCNMSDPVTVLQEPDTGDLCDSEDRERHDDQVHGVGDLDVGLISGKLHTLSDIISCINTGIYVQEPTDILLDVNTAGNNIHISGDRKTASWSDINQNRPETPERFQCPQVISTKRFSSGRHYWEVDVSKSWSWMVGMCYPSIDRGGDQSYIGDNNKSWCMWRYNNQYTVIHDSKVIPSPDNIPCDRVRIYLDYEAGQLSFYSLCDPIRHLHTVTATFTEPLHTALYVWRGCIKISGGVRKRERCNIM